MLLQYSFCEKLSLLQKIATDWPLLTFLRDTKNILMVPCLSPASHAVSGAGEALAEEENQQVWPKK